MSNELTKKAIELLLKGATLLSEPCPYCKGVRVMMKGNALCVSCGKEPKKDQKTESTEKMNKKPSFAPLEILEKKLRTLSKELERESDHEKQQKILKSINSLIEIIAKLKNQQ